MNKNSHTMTQADAIAAARAYLVGMYDDPRTLTGDDRDKWDLRFGLLVGFLLSIDFPGDENNTAQPGKPDSHSLEPRPSPRATSF